MMTGPPFGGSVFVTPGLGQNPATQMRSVTGTAATGALRAAVMGGNQASASLRSDRASPVDLAHQRAAAASVGHDRSCRRRDACLCAGEALARSLVVLAQATYSCNT